MKGVLLPYVLNLYPYETSAFVPTPAPNVFKWKILDHFLLDQSSKKIWMLMPKNRATDMIRMPITNCTGRDDQENIFRRY
jgi:hypothetical protein